MTDETDDLSDPDGTETSAEPAVEGSLDAWGEVNAEPEWTAIEVEGEASGAGAAQPAPGPAPATDADVVQEPAAEPTLAQPQVAAQAGGRSRRPSSLRTGDGERIAAVPRRPIAPPPPPRSRRRFDDSESGVASAPPSPSPQRADTPSLPERFTQLTNERPEVALGVAFLGGLLLASILKRLGRR